MFAPNVQTRADVRGVCPSGSGRFPVENTRTARKRPALLRRSLHRRWEQDLEFAKGIVGTSLHYQRQSISVRRLTTVSEQYQDGAIGAVTSLYSCNKPLRKRIVREFTANVSSCNAFTDISGAQLLTRIICGWQVFERVFNCDETLVHPARLRAAIEKCLRWRLDYVTVAVKRRLSLSTGENVEQLQRHTRVRR